MNSVYFTAETSSDGVVERDFTMGEVTGALWSPASGPDHAPLVLMGHGGGLHKKTPGLLSRALHCVTTYGFTVVAIDAPGHGDRPRSAEDEQARAGLQQAVAAGDSERFKSVSLRYGISLAERAVPEWQATLDALQELPEIGTEAPVGYGGGITLGTAIGIPLTAVEPRITAAIFGGGFFVHEALIEGGAAGHRPGPVPAPVGRRERRPPVGSRAVRCLRLEGKDAARQPGRSPQRALVRAR
jgi:pimeloyl-ACP methyl ester carboxylesterase